MPLTNEQLRRYAARDPRQRDLFAHHVETTVQGIQSVYDAQLAQARAQTASILAGKDVPLKDSVNRLADVLTIARKLPLKTQSQLQQDMLDRATADLANPLRYPAPAPVGKASAQPDKGQALEPTQRDFAF